MTEHISEQDLIQRLYGLDAGSTHLAECAECRARYEALEARKGSLTAPLEISQQELAAQRRAIYSRMGEKPRSVHGWIPALATAALVAIGLFVYQPARKPAPVPQPEVPDSQLFTEISIEQSSEPQAIAPIRALFEEGDQQ
jgi:anti-sigma factor RsiW